MERTAAQRRAFRQQLARREAPQVLLWSAGTVTVLTALYALVFPYEVAILWLHVAEVLLFLLGAWLVRKPRTPDWAVHWILVVCTWGLVGGFFVENLWEPSTIGMVFLVIIFVAFGSFVVDRTAFVIAAIPMVIGTDLVAAAEHPEDGLRWAVVAVSALLLGAMLRMLRLRAFDQLGDALAENEALAVSDPLTQLLNRRGVRDRVDALVALAARNDELVFVAVIDIDGLKAVNDTYGHIEGDAVIRAVAEGLRASTRGSDLIGRWGGDEFIVLGLGDAIEVGTISDRIRASVLGGAIDPGRWHGAVSIGIASARASAFDFDAVQQAADEDMYERRRSRRQPAAQPDA